MSFTWRLGCTCRLPCTCSAALHLFGCPALVRLPCTCSAALHLFGCPALIRLPGARVRVRGGSETVGRVRGALDGHSRTANGHESDCGLLIKKGFGS